MNMMRFSCTQREKKSEQYELLKIKRTANFLSLYRTATYQPSQIALTPSYQVNVILTAVIFCEFCSAIKEIICK